MRILTTNTSLQFITPYLLASILAGAGCGDTPSQATDADGAQGDLAELLDGEDTTAQPDLDAKDSDGRPPATCDDLDCAGQARVCHPEPDGARCGECLDGFLPAGTECEADPSVPQSVTASEGTEAGQVTVTWQPLQGADGYIVYREGVPLNDQPVTTTRFEDDEAPAPPVPGEVPGGLASSIHVGVVIVSWEPAPVDHAPAATYRVAAVIDDATGGLSAGALGYRAASPVTGYEVLVEGEVVAMIDDALTWTDDNLDPIQMEFGQPEASEDRSDGVELKIQPVRTGRLSTRDYRVRAVNAEGPGPASGLITGFAILGTVVYHWEWTHEENEAWSPVGPEPTETGFQAKDTEIPPGTSRLYRAAAQSEWGDIVTSDSVRGTRLNETQ